MNSGRLGANLADHPSIPERAYTTAVDQKSVNRNPSICRDINIRLETILDYLELLLKYEPEWTIVTIVDK